MTAKIGELREKNLLNTLTFLNNGGDFTKGGEYLKKAIEYGIPETRTPGHPLNTFIRENKQIVNLIEEEIMPALKVWQQDGKDQDSFTKLRTGITRLHAIKNHYVRKENSFYPLIVKYNLATETQTSRFWAVDDAARNLVKEVYDMLQEQPLPDKYKIEAAVEKMRYSVLNNVYIASTVLLPVLEEVVSVNDWYVVRQDEIEMGYCLIDLPANWQPTKEEIDQDNLRHDNHKLKPEVLEQLHIFFAHLSGIDVKIHESEVLRGDKNYPVGKTNTPPSLIIPHQEDAVIKLEVGSLSLKEIPAIFNVLPIDLTFVDTHDRVKWFSNSDRIFPRTQSVIGRPVIRCHPPKSIDKVLAILKEFHDGTADSEDFWVTVHGRQIYLKFFAVRDAQDNYLGCLETVQDITKFKYLKGTKTLENKDQFKDEDY